MIIVTGATGQLGRQIVEQLLERVAADRLGVSVRDPARAQDLAERGVRVRHGDFADPSSLASAFEGASRVLVVSSDTHGQAARHQHRTAIDAAGAAGAERVFYTSHVGADPDSAFAPMPDHHATEAALDAGPVASTVLRNGFYASFAAVLLGRAVETGELRAPQDGPVSWTSHADLAQATAIALLDDGLDAPLLELTGSEAVDLDGVAAIAAELTGRPVRRVVVGDDEHRADLLAQGVPEGRVDIVMGVFLASRRGAFSRVSPTLADLIGRPPTTLRNVLRDAIGR